MTEPLRVAAPVKGPPMRRAPSSVQVPDIDPTEIRRLLDRRRAFRDEMTERHHAATTGEGHHGAP